VISVRMKVDDLIEALLADGFTSVRLSKGNQPGNMTYQVRVEHRSARNDGKRVTVDYVANAGTLEEALEDVAGKVSDDTDR